MLKMLHLRQVKKEKEKNVTIVCELSAPFLLGFVTFFVQIVGQNAYHRALFFSFDIFSRLRVYTSSRIDIIEKRKKKGELRNKNHIMWRYLKKGKVANETPPGENRLFCTHIFSVCVKRVNWK